MGYDSGFDGIKPGETGKNTLETVKSLRCRSTKQGLTNLFFVGKIEKVEVGLG